MPRTLFYLRNIWCAGRLRPPRGQFMVLRSCDYVTVAPGKGEGGVGENQSTAFRVRKCSGVQLVHRPPQGSRWPRSIHISGSPYAARQKRGGWPPWLCCCFLSPIAPLCTPLRSFTHRRAHTFESTAASPCREAAAAAPATSSPRTFLCPAKRTLAMSSAWHTRAHRRPESKAILFCMVYGTLPLLLVSMARRWKSPEWHRRIIARVCDWRLREIHETPDPRVSGQQNSSKM